MRKAVWFCLPFSVCIAVCRLILPKEAVPLAALIALNVVITRFLSISTPIFRIGFSFLTIVCAATLFGPIEAAIVGGLGDLLGALLFPSGPFFPAYACGLF